MNTAQEMKWIHRIKLFGSSKDADLSYFAGEITPSVHEALFVYQLKTLMIECIILLSLLGIRSFEMEQQTEMTALIYSAGRGRKIAKDKILASGIVGALYYLVLIFISLAVFFASWDFGRLWDANMASSFHYVIDSDDPILGKPFLTWQSFTLKRYFACTLVLMAGILLAWWLADLGNYSLFAYQEVWTVTLHLFLLTGGLMAGLHYFKRKELT